MLKQLINSIIVSLVLIGLLLLSISSNGLSQSAELVIAEHLTGMVQSNKAQLNTTATDAFKSQILEREPAYRTYHALVKPLLSEQGGYLIEEQWRKQELNREVGCYKVSAQGNFVYFYLIKTDQGWRIDIVRSDLKQSLAMARGEFYLGTKYDWRDNVSKTLRAIRVAYQVQQALETYLERRGSVPNRLYGLGQQNDPLIQVGLLKDRYPLNPFEGKPVTVYGLARRQPVGSLGYCKLPNTGSPPSYLLVLYGLETGIEDYLPLIPNTNIIMVLSDSDDLETDIKKIKSLLKQD